MMLDYIIATVEKNVKDSQERIILDVFSKMVTEHNSMCGCNYCSILKQYIEEKKKLHKYKKWLYDDSLCFEQNDDSLCFEQYILKYKERIQDLKNKKDSLKFLY